MRAAPLALPLVLLLAPACTGSRPDTRSTAAPTAIPAVSGDGAGRTDEGKPFDNDASAVVGHPAPGWKLDRWYNTAPLTLADLRGKVVLVRWFMNAGCPMCSATLPSLKQLDERYGARGLAVVGMYHHKDPGPLDPASVERYVAQVGLRFPVAIDDDWRTLKRWWLDGHEDRKFTSVAFLLDRKGIVRHVHLGGRLAMTDPELPALERYVEALLAEAP